MSDTDALEIAIQSSVAMMATDAVARDTYSSDTQKPVGN